ncbi:TPA: trypsin-like peptidase domain-containing protein [Candidatus Ventrenecus stercoripullorum]|nr:trypsin-like peptidase domain-containing protein [Candidatus Ventrenecus stercoripullorum]
MKEKKEQTVNKTSNKKIILVGIAMFFIGAIGLYLLIYFFPDPFMKTIMEEREVRNVTVTDTGIADAVEKIYDAVVVVKTYRDGSLYATGTGFVYKEDGDTAYILTNNHVIEDGDEIYVEFTDGSNVITTVEGADVYSDIAVLSLSSEHVTTVAQIGSSEDARVGDTVFTVGAPIDSSTYSGTVTRGILSGKNRLVSVSTTNNSTSDMMMSVLQTDAAINSGNSGGPLANANGEVIGITSLKLSSGSSTSASIEGMGFAIPIETALNYAEKLEQGETIVRPQLGITMSNLSDAIYRHYSELRNIDIDSGVYVEEVSSGSPAEKGGLKVGDIIISADGEDVPNLAYLRYLLYNHDVGDTMSLTVYRNGDKVDLTITLDQSAS